MSRKKSIAEKIWPKVDIRGPEECWPFLANRSNGRGNISLYINGRSTSMYASKAAWVATYGDPGKQYVLHHCDVPYCCNPAHMYLGDHPQNMSDMWERNRPSRSKGERHSKAKLTNAQALAIYGEAGSCASIAKRYGISESAVYQIKKGITWAHVTGHGVIT